MIMFWLGPSLHLRGIESCKALAEILGNKSALISLNLYCLDNRQIELAYNFALKCTQFNRHNWMFPQNLQSGPNLLMSRPYVEP